MLCGYEGSLRQCASQAALADLAGLKGIKAMYDNTQVPVTVATSLFPHFMLPPCTAAHHARAFS